MARNEINPNFTTQGILGVVNEGKKWSLDDYEELVITIFYEASPGKKKTKDIPSSGFPLDGNSHGKLLRTMSVSQLTSANVFHDIIGMVSGVYMLILPKLNHDVFIEILS